MNDYVKDIANKEIQDHYKWGIDKSYIDAFNEKIEKSFQDFINSEELKKSWNDINVKDKFNSRLDSQINVLEYTKNDEIAKTVIWPITLELNQEYTKIDLINLENTFNNNNEKKEIPAELNQIFEKIDKSEAFDPDKEPELRDYIQKWERFGAIKEIFKILWRFLKGSSETWFWEFKDLGEEIKKLDLDSKTSNDLVSLIEEFENKISKTGDIKKDLKLTYILSAIKDKKILKDKPDATKKELLQENLEIWDVILLNKKMKKRDTWAKALKAYDWKYETDFIHSAIIISKDPIKIRHSTTFTAQKSWKWHVEEVNLFDYLKKSWTESFDLLSLRPDESTKQKILEFSEKNLNKEYDNNAALWWAIRWIDWDWNSAWSWLNKNKTWKKDDSFNCVEIIAQSLDHEKLQNITQPNEFLEYMDMFQPTYMTSMKI